MPPNEIPDHTTVGLTQYLCGNWPSPWAAAPYLKIRIAIHVPSRTVIQVHQRVRRRWQEFRDCEKSYVAELVSESIEDILDDPSQFDLEATDSLFPPALPFEEDELDVCDESEFDIEDDCAAIERCLSASRSK